MNLVRLRKAIEAIDAATHTDDALFALEELVAAAREICADPDVRLVRFTTSTRAISLGSNHPEFPEGCLLGELAAVGARPS